MVGVRTTILPQMGTHEMVMTVPPRATTRCTPADVPVISAQKADASGRRVAGISFLVHHGRPLAEILRVKDPIDRRLGI